MSIVKRPYFTSDDGDIFLETESEVAPDTANIFPLPSPAIPHDDEDIFDI